MKSALGRRLLAEFTGTGLLVAVVVGAVRNHRRHIRC
jgi:glycerol uptake facilitator-like aquaporin